MARILIPDCLDHAAHAAIRSLTRAGDDCDVAWTFDALTRALGRGRYIRRFHTVTPAWTDPDRYVDELAALCRSLDFDVVMPCFHHAYGALVPRVERLGGHTRTLLPPAEAFAIANDKLRTAERCRSIGIETPMVYAVLDDADARAVASEVRYPAVVKIRSGSGVAWGLRFARNREELVRGVEALVALHAGSPPGLMVQEFVPGYIHDVCALARSGEVVQTLTQVRKLMYPIGGGVGAVNFTTHHPALVRVARRLLESLSWTGPAQIEFKYDERDGRYKLLEINPKLWGTLDLSIKAGIEFPRLLRDLALDRPVVKDRSYPAGVRYKFLFARSAVLAYRQLLAARGWRALRDPQRYTRTHWDLDLRDPFPDLLRGSAILAGLIRGDAALPPGLEPIHVNPLNHALPDRVAAASRRADSGEAAGRAGEL